MAQNRSHERKPPRMAIALAGIALIGSAIVLKEGAPTLLNRAARRASRHCNIATAQNPGGPTDGTPADIRAATGWTVGRNAGCA